MIDCNRCIPAPRRTGACCAAARHLAIQERHFQVLVLTEQHQGGAQAQNAGPKDAHIHIQVAGCWGRRRGSGSEAPASSATTPGSGGCAVWVPHPLLCIVTTCWGAPRVQGWPQRDGKAGPQTAADSEGRHGCWGKTAATAR